MPPSTTPPSLDEPTLAALISAATAAKSASYSPYSSFRVGCALLLPTGAVVAGANVENASYPVSTCAERVALCTAVVQGHRAVSAVAVATDISPAASPCGMCRQALREFCALDVPVVMVDRKSVV